MSNGAENLQIKDVYDCACDLFQELEKIVEVTGVDDACTLITKVKNVLLLLEESVKKIENIDKEYMALKTKCILLSNDKFSKEEEIKNLKQSFEELEESWTKESISLKSLISKLRIENKLLKHRLEEKEDAAPDIGNTFETVVKDQESLILKLKSSLKHKEDILKEQQMTVEALNAEITHLIAVNQSLHVRYEEANRIISAFQQERNESEERTKLQEQKFYCLVEAFEEVKKSITEKVEFGMQNMIDVYRPLYESGSINEERYMALSQEQLELKQKINDLKLELALLQGQLDEYKNELNNTGEIVETEETRGQVEQIFQLFLGLLGLNSGSAARGKRMYSA